MIDTVAEAFLKGLRKERPALIGFRGERVDKALPGRCAGAGVHGFPAPGCAVPARAANFRESQFERAFSDSRDEVVLQAIDRVADAAQSIKRTARHDFDADERGRRSPAYIRTHQLRGLGRQSWKYRARD